MKTGENKIVLNHLQLKILDFITSTAILTFSMLEDYRDSLEASAIKYSNSAKLLGEKEQGEKDNLLSQSIAAREEFNNIKKVIVRYSKTANDSRMFKHQMAKANTPNEYLKIPQAFSNTSAINMIEIFNSSVIKDIKSKVGIHDFFDSKIQAMILEKNS